MNEDFAKICRSSVENACREIIGNTDSLTQKTLLDAMEYSLFAGGKRVRPFLVFAFYKACGGSDDLKPAEYYAAAIEMVHTFSLIHDDLPAMDNDSLRRGRPTNHTVFGEATAILAGDALLAEAFGAVCRNRYCSSEQNAAAALLLAQKSGARGMTGGQQIDMQLEGAESIDGATLNELQLLKTGCLISCACMLGCIAAGADKSYINAAEEYGNSLGLAFQIKDDLLDIESTTQNMGKTVGKDSAENKATYPSVFGIEKSKKTLLALTEKAISSVKSFPDEKNASMLADYARSLMNRTY